MDRWTHLKDPEVTGDPNYDAYTASQVNVQTRLTIRFLIWLSSAPEATILVFGLTPKWSVSHVEANFPAE